MRIIAVVNQKGGVGKTTTSVNLGAALALRGRRVLLVDMDPQGNLTDHLLGDPAGGAERPSVYDVLVEGLPIAKAVTTTATPGLGVVPSHEDMAGCELDLASVIGREVLLRDALAEVPADAWDYVFLDCPPSLGLLSLNALAAADEVLIALQTEFFAMRGLSALDRTIELVRRRINPRLVLGGIVATLVDPTRLSREVMDEVRGHYGDRVFATRVRTNIRLAEAPSHGKHIFDYAPDSAGAADYAALAEEVEAARAAAPVAADDAEAGPPAAGAPTAPAADPPPSAQEPAPSAASKPAPRRGIARAIADAIAAIGRPAAPDRGSKPASRRASAAGEAVAGGETTSPDEAPDPAGTPRADAASGDAITPAPMPAAAMAHDAADGPSTAVLDAYPEAPDVAAPAPEPTATASASDEPPDDARGAAVAIVVEAALAAGAADVLPATTISAADVRAESRATPPPRRALVMLPVLAAGRPISMARMPLRPLATVPPPPAATVPHGT